MEDYHALMGTHCTTFLLLKRDKEGQIAKDFIWEKKDFSSSSSWVGMKALLILWSFFVKGHCILTKAAAAKL